MTRIEVRPVDGGEELPAPNGGVMVRMHIGYGDENLAITGIELHGELQDHCPGCVLEALRQMLAQVVEGLHAQASDTH